MIVRFSKNELFEQDWTKFFATNNPDELWNIMLTKITTVADVMFPEKSFKIRKYRDPWISPELLDLMRDKDIALKKAKNKKKKVLIARLFKDYVTHVSVE